MVGVNAAREQSEHRWRQAQGLLDGVPDEEAQRRLNHQTNTRTWIAVGVLVALSLPIVYFALIVHDSSATPQSPSVSQWREISGLALLIVGLAIEIPFTVQSFRIRRYTRNAPTQVLARPERKQLLKEVRGQQPAVPTHLPLARDLAGRLILQSGQRIAMLGLACIVVGQAISHNGPFSTFIAVVVTVMFAISTFLLTRDNKLARHFLNQYPWPRDQEPSRPT